MYDPRNIFIVVLLTLLVSVSFLYRSANHELTDIKETVAAEKAAAAAEHARIEREQAAIAADTAQGWADAVGYWRKHGGVRVLPAACPDAVPAVPRSAAGDEGLRSGEPRPGATVDAAECEKRLSGSVMDAVWIETVKAWVRKQHDASR